MYIEGEGRHAYLITLLDVFHREVYGWHLGYSMRATIVVNLILDFIDKKLINAEDRAKKIELSFRSDNGSQFISKNYKKLMKKFNLKAVYIPPATPQLNGHIESYHSIVQKEVCDKNEFKNLEACITEMKYFIETYNKERYMTVLLNLPPKPFLKLWEQGHIGKKEVKRKHIFFFKEENKKKQNELANTVLQPMLVDLLSSIEVNLKNNQDFSVSQIKDIVNLPKQIYAN
jgi:putative transposase